MCSLFFFFIGAVSGGLCVLGVTIYQQRKLRRNQQLPSAPPIYEELTGTGGRSAVLMVKNPVQTEVDSHIELATNAAYGDSCIGLTTNAAYGQID